MLGAVLVIGVSDSGVKSDYSCFLVVQSSHMTSHPVAKWYWLDEDKVISWQIVKPNSH